MAKRYVVEMRMTVLQAETLLRLAQEAEIESLVSEDGISAMRRWRAADAAMNIVSRALGKASRA